MKNIALRVSPVTGYKFYYMCIHVNVGTGLIILTKPGTETEHTLVPSPATTGGHAPQPSRFTE